MSRLGRPSIAHATSAGKVMLAFSGRELPDGPFRAYTTRTITDPQALAAEIEAVRERGYAQAVGEREPGLTAIAAPMRSARGELEAIVALRAERALRRARGRRALPLLLERAARSQASSAGGPADDTVVGTELRGAASRSASAGRSSRSSSGRGS